MPVSSCTTRWPASRSASASVRCSPCDACVRASRPSIVEASSSSRCGPTRVTPRSISARRRRSSSVAQRLLDVAGRRLARSTRRRRGGPVRFVAGRHRTCFVVGENGVRVGDRRAEAIEQLQAAADELGAGTARAGRRSTSSVVTRVVVAHAAAQQSVALLQDPLEVGPGRVVAHCEHPSSSSRYARRSDGPSFTSARSSGANTVTRSNP